MVRSDRDDIKSVGDFHGLGRRAAILSLGAFGLEPQQFYFSLLLGELLPALLPILFNLNCVAFTRFASCCLLRLLLGLTTLLFLVLALTFLSLEHLTENGLRHHLVNLLLEVERLIRCDTCADATLGCRRFDNQAKLFAAILAVGDAAFLALLALGELVLVTLLKQSLYLHPDRAPGPRAAIDLLQFLEELLVLYRFAHTAIIKYKMDNKYL